VWVIERLQACGEETPRLADSLLSEQIELSKRVRTSELALAKQIFPKPQSVALAH
jgi:hypothetical protein